MKVISHVIYGHDDHNKTSQEIDRFNSVRFNHSEGVASKTKDMMKRIPTNTLAYTISIRCGLTTPPTK
jgi:hypothetical protein